jgi:hypothetical protein
MRWAKIMAVLVLMQLCGYSQISVGQTTKPSADAATDGDRALALLSKYVGGEWKIQATWSSGEALSARQSFVWGPGKKFIRSAVYVKTPADGTEYMRYETIYGVREGKLIGWGFNFDGTTSEIEMRVISDTALAVDRTMEGAGGKVTLKQTITLTDDDHFAWKVWTDRDGQQTQLMDGVWIRSN